MEANIDCFKLCTEITPIALVLKRAKLVDFDRPDGIVVQRLNISKNKFYEKRTLFDSPSLERTIPNFPLLE